MQVNLSGLLLNGQGQRGAAGGLLPQFVPTPQKQTSELAPVVKPLDPISVVQSAVREALAARNIELSPNLNTTQNTTDALISQLKELLGSGRVSKDVLRSIVDQAFADANTLLTNSGRGDGIESLNAAQASVDQVFQSQAPGVATQQFSERFFFDESRQTSLSIQTSEGDLVRLSFASRETLGAEGFRNVSSTGTEAGASLLLSSSERVSVSVVGDLNADERAAIQDLLDQTEVLADEFFSGNTQAAFQLAQELDIGSEQLAAFDLRLRSVTQVSYEALGDRIRPLEAVGPNGVAPREGVNVEPALIPKPLSLQKPQELKGVGGSEEQQADPAQDRALMNLFGGLDELFSALADFVNQVVESLGLEPAISETQSISPNDRFEIFTRIIPLLSPTDDAKDESVASLTDLTQGFVQPVAQDISEKA